MGLGKVIFATEIMGESSSQVQRLIDLRTLGLEEIIFVHSSDREDLKTRVADSGIPSRTLRVKGRFVPSILNAAHREAVSLIVVSLNTDMGSRLRRSVIKSLLQSSPVPVILLPKAVRTSGAKKVGMFDHIVFATDWSATCEKAMHYLLDFKEIVKALEIVHVIEKRLSIKDMRDLKEKLSQTRKILLEQGIDAESHIYAGKPSEEIMLAAKDYDATCIVMGTTRKSRMKALLSRSNSYRVAEASVVPMLVIP